MTLLSACRPSPALTQIVYTQDADKVDDITDTSLADNRLENVLRDPNMPAFDRDKSDYTKDRDYEARKHDKPNTDKGQAPKKTPGATDKDKTAGGGADAQGTSSSTDADSSRDGSADSGKGDTDGGRSDDPNARPIYDYTGREVMLPHDVNSVVAAGDAAAMVQMLGGNGILTGTNQDFKESSLASAVYADEGLANAKTLWSGSGTSPMSSSDFAKLIELKPDAVVSSSGIASFTAAQISALRDAQIAYVVLPPFNTHDSIMQAARITGAMIGDRRNAGGQNATSLASTYISYCDSLISSVSSRAGGRFAYNSVDYNNDVDLNGIKYWSGTNNSSGRYALYIDAWDDSATFKLISGATIVEERGMAAVPAGYSYSPISYYMSVAGTVNNAATFINTSSRYYGGIPINVNTGGDVQISGSSLGLVPYGDRTRSFAIAPDTNYLGNTAYKTVFVDSRATQTKLLASRANSGGIWQIGSSHTIGGSTQWGFLGIGGALVYSYVSNAYNVYVMPQGVAYWGQGSCESVLASMYCAWRVRDAFSEAEMKAEIKKFYSNFYRHDLTNAQLDSILAGK